MQFRKTLIMAALASTLMACGSSSDSSDSNQTPNTDNSNSGSDQTLTSIPDTVIGKIASATTNSISVNSYEVSTASVETTYQGEVIDASVLIEGMPVTVFSTDDVVTEIAIDPDVAGEVTAISTDSITVAGETYTYSGNDVAVGDYVFLVLENSSVVALTDTGAGMVPLWTEIEGFIASLDSTEQQLVVNGVTVDYSTARIEDGEIAINSYVEIVGTYADGVLVATEIEIERDSNTGEVETGGVITWVNETYTAFELSNLYTFEILSSTRIEDGVAADLQVGGYAEATTVDGVLTELDLEGTGTNSSTPEEGVSGSTIPANFSVSGVMDYSNNLLTFNGYTFVIDSNTRFDDYLTLETLAGASLELEGVVRNGSYVVREVELMDNDAELDIEGQVTDGTLWGYTITDASLSAYEGLWIDVECYFDGNTISNCALDD
ncbi:DUF5666 domain-containing protein [Alteromonas confluentis]|uniref:DUF5666 domain-containing protein n=1 Tax=Alteromonas confluentis TaxID=1656094 RepID=A0A1E7Z7A6_9ALTE|nr:DUF5666 domain-containing protein [Alteromonas confluentis]OFC69418.1 hypothetical protein BFC18_18595 [Alteromonas confluentis]